MYRSIRRVAPTTALLLVVATVLTCRPAAAHEERQVGSYQLAVGWEAEPTYAGEPNGVQVFIQDASGKPVYKQNARTALKAQVSYGSQTSDTLELEPAWDASTSGEWNAAIAPTQAGVYTFHLTGSLNGQAIDEKFTSSDTTFESAESLQSIEFPTKTPSSQELAAAQVRTQANLADAAATADDAKSSSDTLMVVTIIGLVVAIALGGGALFVALRRKPSS